jgi:hypothetical protein
MARNKQASQRTAQATADGYENFVARVGMQTPNQHSASTYRANFTSRNRMLVEWSYRVVGYRRSGRRYPGRYDPQRHSHHFGD